MSVTGKHIRISKDELSELLETVRMVLRDYADRNFLLMDVQFTDKEMIRAIELTVSEFNSIPPMTSIDWRFIPEDLLFKGVASWLLLSESFLQLRNQVSVPTDGLGVVGVDDKTQFYQQLRAQLKSEFDEKARNVKDAMNIASGFGSLSSGYAGVSRFSQN